MDDDQEELWKMLLNGKIILADYESSLLEFLVSTYIELITKPT